MAPYEALYGRKCRSPLCWTEVGERRFLGPEMIQEVSDQVQMIKEKMQRAQARQKSYYDNRHKPLSFDVGDHVFLRIAPTSGLGRRLGMRMLSPRYLGPFLILDRIGESAYRRALPPNLAGLHDVFHVSQLRRYIYDSSHVLQPEDVELRENLTYTVRPFQILERSINNLRSKEVPLVKVQWNDMTAYETTWERQDELRKLYPEFFE
ncbi:uncharacterized protein LOC133313905 [Gastrolobium bilobum]|uniref:uncharacterized protein LOC133313905 n=1 Tax=Gastrolobium bilobum TaxID=150636 RepID=UPI002AB05203|nr:uncharacterized protein LOC133313905 [Gastrolobium bilobum]